MATVIRARWASCSPGGCYASRIRPPHAPFARRTRRADGYADRFDATLLVSADSDLVPPTLAVRRLFPHKRIVVPFPPSRSSVELQRAASAFLIIGRRKLAQSEFPDEVTKPDGSVLRRPAHWR